MSVLNHLDVLDSCIINVSSRSLRGQWLTTGWRSSSPSESKPDGEITGQAPIKNGGLVFGLRGLDAFIGAIWFMEDYGHMEEELAVCIIGICRWNCDLRVTWSNRLVSVCSAQKLMFVVVVVVVVVVELLGFGLVVWKI